MGKRSKGPPYTAPDDAQWIVVLYPPHILESNGNINYSPLQYWLRALFDDQPVAKFIYEVQTQPDLVVIVELPSPNDLDFPAAAYGLHSLRLGLKRRPWFTHPTGLTVILPYNFKYAGHPENTQSMCSNARSWGICCIDPNIPEICPMIPGNCENDWEKLDLTIPYPTPQRFDFRRVPKKAELLCRRPPGVMPPPPDSMEIDRYPTPPAQERQRDQASQPEQPLFIPEDDCTFPSYPSSVCFDPTLLTSSS